MLWPLWPTNEQRRWHRDNRRDPALEVASYHSLESLSVAPEGSQIDFAAFHDNLRETNRCVQRLLQARAPFVELHLPVTPLFRCFSPRFFFQFSLLLSLKEIFEFCYHLYFPAQSISISETCYPYNTRCTLHRDGLAIRGAQP
jgi:hypothetical protein